MARQAFGQTLHVDTHQRLEQLPLTRRHGCRRQTCGWRLGTDAYDIRRQDVGGCLGGNDGDPLLLTIQLRQQIAAQVLLLLQGRSGGT